MTKGRARLRLFSEDLKRYPPRSFLRQPALWAIAVFRFGNFAYKLPKLIRWLGSLVYYMAFSIVRLMTGIEIPRSAKIGPGLMIHHFGGIVIHPQAEIGENFTIRQGVTVGSRHDTDDVPRIGNNVSVGAYGQIIGNVTIGNFVTVGALTLVLEDVPDYATAVGIPARILK